MESERAAHELGFVRSFIQKDRCDRCLLLLQDSNRRRKFTAELAHFKWFDTRYTKPISPSVAHTSPELVTLLKQNGAGPVAWIISEDTSIDGHALPLQEAMDCVWGGQMGSVLSCIPGKLAFYRGEEMKSELLLKHQ